MERFQNAVSIAPVLQSLRQYFCITKLSTDSDFGSALYNKVSSMCCIASTLQFVALPCSAQLRAAPHECAACQVVSASGIRTTLMSTSTSSWCQANTLNWYRCIPNYQHIFYISAMVNTPTDKSFVCSLCLLILITVAKDTGIRDVKLPHRLWLKHV